MRSFEKSSLIVEKPVNSSATPILIPIWLILALAALNGLVYWFLVPPWQHNDEPGNFETVWLFANAPELLKTGGYDQAMRRELAASMVEHAFFAKLGMNPNLIGIDQEIWIGLAQYPLFRDSAILTLYFRLASLPLRLVPNTDITFQLYVARGFSYLLFLATVAVANQASKLLTDNPTLASLIPLTMALWPNLADKMTAVNDDAGAVSAMSLFLWVSVAILKRGLTFWRLIGLGASVVLCILTKRNVWQALPFGILVLYLTFWRRKPLLGWLSLTGILLVVSTLVFSRRQSIPAYFYTLSNQTLAQREQSTQTVAGRHVFRLDRPWQVLYQPLGEHKLKSLKGQSLTLGIWMWSDSPITISAPQIQIDNQNSLPPQQLALTTQAAFYSFKLSVPVAAQKIAFNWQIPELAENQVVYSDCIFLVPEIATDSTPKPVDERCALILSAGKSVQNLLHNGSAERGWPTLQERVAKWMDRYFFSSITNVWAILDRDTGWAYIKSAGRYFFESFWGRFGWGSIVLSGGSPFLVFTVLTFLALLGNLLALWRQPKQISVSLILFLTLLTLVTLYLGLFRTAGNWVRYEAMPNARYLLPAIFPIAAFLVSGWYHVSKASPLRKIPPSILFRAYVLALVCYNGWAWFSIWQYLYS